MFNFSKICSHSYRRKFQTPVTSGTQHFIHQVNNYIGFIHKLVRPVGFMHDAQTRLYSTLVSQRRGCDDSDSIIESTKS